MEKFINLIKNSIKSKNRATGPTTPDAQPHLLNMLDLPANKETTEIHMKAQGFLDFDEERLYDCIFLTRRTLSLLQLSNRG